MNPTIAHKSVQSLIGGRSGLEARLWPNGEIAIWKPRSFKPAPMQKYDPDDRETAWKLFSWRLALLLSPCEALASLLGSSSLPISDISEGAIVKLGQGLLKARAAKGSTGITSYGKRMVRNAAHLIESESGWGRAVFATVTVPSLPLEQMRVLHEKWGQVTEHYRLGLRRALQNKGLSGESVTVSEIQEKRYEQTGLPVLHLHSIFCGVTAIGKFALSIEQHDRIWFFALRTAVDIDRTECTSACNLQRVKKSASGYMAKYLTKGSAAVVGAIKDGFSAWLPKHWWNCSRSLSRRVKSQTRDASSLAEWLNAVADIEGNNVWKWHRDVVLEMSDGHKITIARYGQLTKGQTAEVQTYYSSA